MRTWGTSGAGAAFRRAQAVSAWARRSGCGVDEADEEVGREWSRRRFLGGAAAAAAIPALGALPRQPYRTQPDGARHQPRVVIAGAGIAGLGCAYRLWRRCWTSSAGPPASSRAPPEAMVRGYLDGFGELFPGVGKAYNGRAYYVWSPGDPHILGAYSYLKPGQYTGFNGIQGLQEGNVHFAGEQTSVNFQGYIEGGLRSGYRCAREIGG